MFFLWFDITELIMAYVLNCLIERAIYSMGGARLLNYMS